MKISFRPLFFATLFLVTFSARADELAIIAKARASLGTEDALNAVKTIHYVGTLVVADNAKPQAPIKIDIVFAQPERQRVTATYDKGVEYTVLDGYEGWQKLQDNSNAARWQLTLLSKDQIKRLRANTWENLSFFRGIEKTYGEARNDGVVTVDGIACVKVAYIHAPDIIFYRYFNQETGRLALSETENGGKIREEGELFAEGVRFPKKIITTTTTPDGHEQSVTLLFDKITINETFADSLFAVPEITH